VSLLAKDIPEDHRESLGGEPREAEFLNPGGHVLVLSAGKCHPGEISLDVCHEDGDAYPGELLGNHPEAHGLPCSRSAGDEPVPVRHGGQNTERALAPGYNEWFVLVWHGCLPDSTLR